MSEFQPLWDLDENDDEVTSPIVDAIKNGGKIDNVVLGDEWTDDHCPCINVTATINGTEYQYSDWWLSSAGLKMYYQAEGGLQSALNALNEHVKSVIANA